MARANAVRAGVPRRLAPAALLVMLTVAACASEEDVPSAETANGIETRGEQLYALHCRSCHGDREGEGRAAGAPPHNEAGHTWHHPDAQLLEWILDGRPGTAMPAFGDELSEEDARAILAFIKTWWTDEQRELQADVSERYQEALERQ